MEILKVSSKAFYKYRTYVRGRKNCTEDQCRRLLTRNFILGHDRNKRLEDSIVRRRYGNLNIIVDMDTFTVIDIFNEKGTKNNKYINEVEKNMLNKILGVENDSEYIAVIETDGYYHKEKINANVEVVSEKIKYNNCKTLKEKILSFIKRA